jgi:hypothetical protein
VRCVVLSYALCACEGRPTCHNKGATFVSASRVVQQVRFDVISALCARVTLRTPTQQGGDAQGKWITDSFQGGCRERRFCGPHVEKFWNVPERSRSFPRDTKDGSSRLTICFSYRQPEKAATSGQSPEEKREPVPANWEEREGASATTTEAMETGAPAAAAAEIGAKRARDEAEESGEEEAPTRTKVLIRGGEVGTETPKKTAEKSGDTKQPQPGQG